MARTAEPMDADRRRWVAAASVAGGAGAVATSVPFVASFAPSERARAFGAPVEVDIRPVKPAELATVEWRGKPVWILRRTPPMLSTLRMHDDLLADPRSGRVDQQPAYARNEFRSIKPDVAVLVAICTHLGCVPTFRPTPGAPDISSPWPGGFYCPRHGSKFDLAGRVFKNVPAPSNLEVPAHHYRTETTLVIGEDPPQGSRS
jgi:ubiquinol-cytochrome c reductase iron-sulfur subunit